MKKLLFTLCAVLAGFAANAENSFTFQYVDAEGNALAGNEIIMAPGAEATVHVQVTSISDVVVQGFSWNLYAKNQAGEKTGNTGDVQLKNLGDFLNVFYYQAEGMTTFPGATVASSTPNTPDGIPYRIIATNTARNIVFGNAAGIAAKMNMPVETIMANVDPVIWTVPGYIFSFTITTDANWDEEYATLDIDQAETKASWADGTTTLFPDNDLKVINKNKIPTPKDLAGTVEFTVDEATGKVTAEFKPGEGDPETVNIKVMYNGEEVTMPYQLTDGAEPITLTYEVTAEGYNPLAGTSQPLSWTAPAPQLEDLEGEVTYTVDPVTGKVTVAYEPADGEEDVNVTIVVKVDGQVVENPYQLTDGEETTLEVTVSADGFNDLTDSKDLTWNKPTVETPVITFEETMDGEVVTAVDVVIVNYTSYTITNNDQPVRATVAHFDANYTEDQVIKVTAENVHADYSEVTATAEDTYTLKKLEKKNVPAPEVNPQTGDDAVTLNITWPESDGTQMFNGQPYTDETVTEFPRLDADYTVALDVYVTAGATCNESAHYTETITIPKKVVAPVDTTGQPAFQGPATKPNHNAYFYTITNAESEQNATIYYRVLLDGEPQGATDENPEGWQVYTGEFGIYGAHDDNHPGQDGHYRIEAYAVAPGKAPSKVIATEVNIDWETGIAELINGKAIANVRYFNMAGQEMQEANGMTIVVTTYTDGTTSAVKVMK